MYNNNPMYFCAASDRQQLLRAVQVQEFFLTDLALYLDSHPDCSKGLACYQQHKAMHDEAAAAYMEKYGPLCMSDVNVCNGWNWVNSPWPWELEG